MSTPPRSRLRARPAVLPSSATPEGTRRRILEVALQLFACRGFHDASIRDLAKALALRPSALYAHFPSKEHVLAELVRLGHEVHHEGLRAALASAGDAPVARLRALVRAHTLLHAHHPQLAVVVNEEIHALPPELAAPSLLLRERSSALLREVIEQGRTQGVFSASHPLVTGAAIATMGLRLPYWYEPTEGLDAETLADVHAELALRMLGVHAGA
ncbi:TetR/AcrR family transcriptional regulator [Corallococcus sp. H22C18031201]|uniref:TetR/AcrR family transcriptional regulator n=1 Tax=Citreicoccus inhibens TaxID=2849499 RepID=UPI000E71D9F3|nr:TetR/AcrR family transcriptional regulator [Citreicoccus inhibens]MBU8894165.1 TetR/AcrR family transcriptional regulator [Citreicoccus inhibens]RJS23133.1 TetR/AcrR family transcriptional regulator [Corallococcus sp. H22C18031201]